MVYADLLNPYSLRSILQIQKGKEKTGWTQSWDVFTKGMVDTVSQEEMFQLPSLLGGGRSLRTFTTAGGTAGGTFGGDFLHLSDLAPASFSSDEEESMVMEFDMRSDGIDDGGLW